MSEPKRLDEETERLISRLGSWQGYGDPQIASALRTRIRWLMKNGFPEPRSRNVECNSLDSPSMMDYDDD